MAPEERDYIWPLVENMHAGFPDMVKDIPMKTEKKWMVKTAASHLGIKVSAIQTKGISASFWRLCESWACSQLP